MSKFTDRLLQDLVREHGPNLAHVDRLQPSRAHALRRPRVLAGSTLGLAGVGTALALALSAGSTPAYAVTTNNDGSVLVTLNQSSALPQANARLASMGTNEQISIQMTSGAAVVNGAVQCTSSAPGASMSGPPVKVLLGTNGTEAIPSNNTGAGTWHVGACSVESMGKAGSASNGSSGNTGN